VRCFDIPFMFYVNVNIRESLLKGKDQYGLFMYNVNRLIKESLLKRKDQYSSPPCIS